MAFMNAIASGSFSSFVDAPAPGIVASSAEVFHLFGGSAAKSKRNYVGAKADATIIGSPQYYDGYCRLSNHTDGFNSGVAGNSPFTTVVVCRKVDGYIYAGNAQPGTFRNMLAPDVNPLGLTVDNAARVTVAEARTGWIFVAATHASPTAAIHVGTSGALAKTTGAYTGGTLGTINFRVGACTATGSAIQYFECAMAMKFASVLSDANILSLYTYALALMPTRGIALL